MRFGVEASPGPGGLRTPPEWDLIYEDGTVLVLEEAKSGAIKAEDRWTLWRRVRRTVAGLLTTGNVPLLHVRLTVNAANLPATPEDWRTLPVQSQHVEGSWTTPRTKDDHRRPVRSASDLANEALHVLSSADSDTTSPPVTLDRARDILAQFQLNEQYTADSVEDQVRNHLAVLSRGAGVEVLLNAVRGELTRRAESVDVARRTFTADDLLKALEMLERLAALDPDTLRRWHELRGTADSNARGRDDSPVGLSYQEWRELQPHISGVLDPPPLQPVALLGRGGIGKSVLLEHWLAERQRLGDETLLLTANDLAALEPDQVAAALDLGVFGARHRGKRMAIGVDGVENAADDQRRVRLLSALRSVAASDVTLCVTSRLLEWRSARGSSETLPGWRDIELVEWPEERIRDHVNATGRPRIHADLLRLLRVPLLLDLFLRTFGRDEDVPSGLQTRHGLLQAYWDRRVLPAEDERSASRRVLLLELARSEAGGVNLHTTTGDAARYLTSEGVLTLVRGGLRQFRHALLRDFALMQWVREPPTSGSREVERLTAIRPPLVQFGALRAVLEAKAAAGGNDRALLAAMTPPLLFHAGTVLGEFEELAVIDLRATVDAVTPPERSDFLRSLLLAAKLERNVAWASVIARLPSDPAWVTNTAWVTAAFVLQLLELLETMSAELRPPNAAAIASLLRTWSHAPRLNEELRANNGYTLGRLFKLLAEVDPSSETLKWLTRIQYEGSWTRFWVLSELPGLLRRMAAEKRPLEEDGLRAVYVAAAGLQEEAGRLRDDVNLSRDATSGYERFELALIGDRNAEGLISTCPSVFVSIAVDLIAGHEADDADKREEHLRDIEARWPADLKLFEGPSDDIKALQEAARKVAGSELSEELASGSLIVDTPTDPYWQLYSEREHLLLHLRNLAETSLSSDGAFFDAFLWPAVSKSRSALARVCVLDLLTREGDGPRPDVLDELLQDGRLYFLRCARRYLRRGIRFRWTHLSVGKRESILANVSNCGRQPAGDVYRPGPFIAAIPEADRPAEFAVFIELHRANGWELEEEEERPISFRSGHRASTDGTEWTPIGGLSTELQEPWKRLAAWERGRIPQATGADWSALVATVESLVTASLPSPEMLLAHGGPVERLSEFAHTHASTEGTQREPRLSSVRFASWRFGVLMALSCSRRRRSLTGARPSIVRTSGCRRRPSCGCTWSSWRMRCCGRLA